MALEEFPYVLPEEGDGPCFRDALRAAGIEADIPDWPFLSEIQEFCKANGLDFNGSDALKGTRASDWENHPLIVIYKTKEHRGHAEYTQDLRALIDQGIPIAAIIRLMNSSD